MYAPRSTRRGRHAATAHERKGTGNAAPRRRAFAHLRHAHACRHRALLQCSCIQLRPRSSTLSSQRGTPPATSGKQGESARQTRQSEGESGGNEEKKEHRAGRAQRDADPNPFPTTADRPTAGPRSSELVCHTPSGPCSSRKTGAWLHCDWCHLERDGPRVRVRTKWRRRDLTTCAVRNRTSDKRNVARGNKPRSVLLQVRLSIALELAVCSPVPRARPWPRRPRSASRRSADTGGARSLLARAPGAPLAAPPAFSEPPLR